MSEHSAGSPLGVPALQPDSLAIEGVPQSRDPLDFAPSAGEDF